MIPFDVVFETVTHQDTTYVSVVEVADIFRTIADHVLSANTSSDAVADMLFKYLRRTPVHRKN